MQAKGKLKESKRNAKGEQKESKRKSKNPATVKAETLHNAKEGYIENIKNWQVVTIYPHSFPQAILFEACLWKREYELRKF